MIPVKYLCSSRHIKCLVNSTARDIFVSASLSAYLMSQSQSLRSRIRKESVRDINFLKVINTFLHIVFQKCHIVSHSCKHGMKVLISLYSTVNTVFNIFANLVSEK